MRRTDRTMLSIASLAIALLVGSSVAWGAETDDAPDAFGASSGLFELAVPVGWMAEEHVDGGGVRLASAAGDTVVEMTFIPSAVLQSALRLGAPAGAGPMAIAEGLALLLPPAEGVEAAEPALVELANGEQAVELAAAGTDVEGALYILEPAAGVTTLVSVAAASGGFEGVRDATIEVLSSLMFSGDADGLMELLDPPPLVDVVIG
jgi:hypothetical protein